MTFKLLAGVLACVLLTGCQALGAMTGGDTVGRQVLSNLQGCARHYEGAIGAGVTGSFRIDCPAQVTAEPAP